MAAAILVVAGIAAATLAGPGSAGGGSGWARGGAQHAKLAFGAHGPSTGERARHGWGAMPAAARVPITSALAAKDPAYRARPAAGGFASVSAPQRLRARFGAGGVSLASGDARWSLRLTGVGDTAAIRSVGAVHPLARANRVVYSHPGVQEWYRNGPLGLEQGFTVARPASPLRGALVVSMAISGNLSASLAQHGRSLVLSRGGRRVLAYRDLAAQDARGRRLPARMTVTGRTLRLEVDTRGAAFPVRIDPVVQQAELTAADAAASDRLGYSVAVSADGSTMVAGALYKNNSQGAVYVFTKPGAGGWANATQTAELTAADAADGDDLGVSVAVSADGSTIIAGAYYKNSARGAVYVFTKPGSGGWANATQTAELTAADAANNDFLGYSVAVSADGSTIVAGAYYKNSARGAAYVFTKPGSGGWANATQTAELTAADAANNDRLGISVAVSADGSTIIAGANSKNSYRGAVYVFTEPGSGGWANATQTAELTAADAANYDYLGISVAVSADGSTIIAGAHNKNSAQGAVYVFTKPGSGGWADATQTAELTAADAAAGDDLGASVAVSADGSAIIAGAFNKNSGQGAVYVFGPDSTAPSSSDDVPSYPLGQSTWTVTLHSSDTGGAGVGPIKYLIGTDPADPSVAANDPLTYNPSAKPTLAPGQRIRYYATDNAGNAEVPHSSAAFQTATGAYSWTSSIAGSTGTNSYPQSVAIADLNGDGRPDLVASDIGGKVVALEQNADGSYTTADVGSTGTGPIALAVGDINGDGRLDVVTANHDSNNITVLIQNGDGTFTSTSTPSGSTGNHPYAVAIGDLNGDGRPDIATANAGDNDVTVFTQNSDGSFTGATAGITGGAPQSVAIGDLNGDGRLDIVTGGYYSDTVTVLTQKSDGTYASATMSGAGGGVSSIAIGDLNADGRPDIAAADGNGVTVFTQNSGGTYDTSHAANGSGQAWRVAIGDLNGDGRPDLATVNVGNTFSVLTQSAGGTYTATSPGNTGGSPNGVAIGDLNGDGIPDLVSADGNDSTITVLTGHGDSSPPSTTDDVPTTWSGQDVTVTLDASDAGSGVAHTYYEIGSPPATPTTSSTPYSSASKPTLTNGQQISYFSVDNAGNQESVKTSSAAKVDATAPTSTDDVPATYRTSPITVTLGADDGSGSGVATIKYLVGANPADPSDPANSPLTYSGSSKPTLSDGERIRYFATDAVGNAEAPHTSRAAIVQPATNALSRTDAGDPGTAPAATVIDDLDGDGLPDLAFADDTAPGTVTILSQNSDGSYTSSTAGPTGDNPTQLLSADLDGDGARDLVTANASSVTVLTSSAGGGYTPHDIATGSDPRIALADIAGNGATDIVVSDATGLFVLVNDGSGGFAKTVIDGTLGSADAISVHDVNGDGVPDIVLLDGGDLVVLTGNGSGGYTKTTVTGLPAGADQLATGDLDGDGAQDFVVGSSSSGTLAAVTNDRSGSFTVTDIGTATGTIIGLATADLDGDGNADPIVITSGPDQVLAYYGDPSGGYASKPVGSPDGAPQSVAVGDLNGDGRIDVVVGTAGAAYVFSAAHDGTAPTTTDDVDSAWHASVTATLTADDGSGSGVASTQYNVYTGDTAPAKSDSGWQTYSSPVSLSNGQRIAYYSVDNVDNEEPVEHSNAAKVDATAPSTTDDVDTNWHASNVTATLTAGDGSGSDVASTHYNVYSGDTVPAKTESGWQTYTTPVSLSDGQHIAYYSVDNVDNEETVEHSAAAKVDTTAPSTSDDVPRTYQNRAVAVTLTPADVESGVDKTYYTKGVSPAKPDTSSAVYDPANKPTLGDGESIRYFSVDHVGNAEADRTSSPAKVDSVAPSTSDDVPATGQGNPTVTLTAADTGGSGVDKTYYTTGVSPAAPTSSSAVYDPANKPTLRPGEMISYFSVDKAGNAEKPHTSGAMHGPPAQTPPPAPSKDTPVQSPPDAWVGTDGTASVALACPSAQPESCHGVVELRTSQGKSKPRTAAGSPAESTVVLATLPVDVLPGKSELVKLKLNLKARRLLAARGPRRLVVRAVFVGTDVAGKPVETLIRTFTLGVRPRPAARSLSQSTKSKRVGARTVFVTHGRLRAPRHMTARAACRDGQVVITVRQGHRRLRTAKVTLTRSCTFHATTTVTAHGQAALKIQAAFLGSLAVRPMNGHTQRLAP